MKIHWTLGSLAILMASVTAARAVDEFPQAQTRHGITVRLTRAKWAAAAEVNRVLFPWDDKRQKVLAIWYQVQRDGAPADDRTSPDLMTVRLFEEGGEHLNMNPQQLPMGNIYKHVSWPGIDPRQKKMTLEFEIPRSGRPAQADGKSVEELAWRDVPLPETTGQRLKINRVLITARGTRVELQEVFKVDVSSTSTSTGADGKPVVKQNKWTELRFVVATDPAPASPVAVAKAALMAGGVTDAAGRDVNPPDYSYATSTSREIIGNTQRWHLASHPPATEKSVNLKVRVTEETPSLRQDEWFPRFRFEFDPRALPRDTSASEPPPSLAQSETPQARVEVESVRPATPSTPGSPRRAYRVRFWTRPQSGGATLLPWKWQVRADTLEARDDKNNVYAYGHNTESVYWKPDGAALRDNENGQDILLACNAVQGEPARFDLNATLLASRSIGPAIFDSLPLPAAPGDIVTPRRVFEHPSGAKLILWKIGAFDAAHALQPTRADSRPTSAPGLAVVFEYRPVPDAAKLASVWFEPGGIEAGAGHTMRAGVKFGEMIFPGAPGDLLKAGEESGRWHTLLLPPAPAGAKTLRLAMTPHENLRLEPAPALSWKNVPIPVAATP